MQLTIDLPDDLATFAQQSADLLEYDSVDTFITALLERQRETLQRGVAAPAEQGAAWHPNLHDPLRRHIHTRSTTTSAMT